jgi:hypothetical protein
MLAVGKGVGSGEKIGKNRRKNGFTSWGKAPSFQRLKER